MKLHLPKRYLLIHITIAVKAVLDIVLFRIKKVVIDTILLLRLPVIFIIYPLFAISTLKRTG
jgi:hypothetical protein